jgi:hypothetical protein
VVAEEVIIWVAVGKRKKYSFLLGKKLWMMGIELFLVYFALRYEKFV